MWVALQMRHPGTHIVSPERKRGIVPHMRLTYLNTSLCHLAPHTSTHVHIHAHRRHLMAQSNRNYADCVTFTNSNFPHTIYTHYNRFTALFPGPSGWACARRELLDFMMQGKGKTNRGRHTDHLAVRQSIWTNQCPPPPSLTLGDWKRAQGSKQIRPLHRGDYKPGWLWLPQGDRQQQ